jgi:CheY-like chemotaxis protein
VADSVGSLNVALKGSSQSYDNILFDPKDWNYSEGEMLRIRKQATSAKLTVLLPAGQRSQFEKYKKSGAGSWLIRPVREASLLAVLIGQGKTDAPAETSMPAGMNGNKAVNSGRVLLAEDNDINALLATSVLKKSGYIVKRVHNGRDAVKEYTSSLCDAGSGKSSYDSILMDMHMPVLDGNAAVDEIRSIEKSRNLPSVPIYVLTADERSSTRSRVLKAGASDLLVKPLDPARLLELVSGSHIIHFKQDTP